MKVQVESKESEFPWNPSGRQRKETRHALRRVADIIRCSGKC